MLGHDAIAERAVVGIPDDPGRNRSRAPCALPRPTALAAMGESIEWTEADGHLMAGTYVGPQAVVDGVFMRLG